ncbi:hypothetical protein PVAP13_1NG396276 [Panicum virgatum]|uniref:Uncharacterized protein n=1 Tax=Panicum virgatum TaxID=38727 RepID=A0A8T0WKI5_PANVG|nr:hypothetical protein PVAP13_1NG396276 [Panicum virgatum]
MSSWRRFRRLGRGGSSGLRDRRRGAALLVGASSEHVKTATMPPLRRKRHVEVDEEYDEFEDDADNMSDDEDA